MRGQAVEVSGRSQSLVGLNRLIDKEILGEDLSANLPVFVLNAFIIPYYKPLS